MLIKPATLPETEWLFRDRLRKSGKPSPWNKYRQKYRQPFNAITQIEVVKGVSNGAAPGVITCTLGTPTVSGELVVVAIFTNNAGNAPTTVTDNLSGSYTQIYSVTAILTHY